MNRGHNIKYLPYAFTEHGVAMLSSVLRSQRAALVNIAIMRAFVRLREILTSHGELAKRLDEIERHLDDHDARLGAHAGEFRAVLRAIKRLMNPPVKRKRQIGFLP